MSGPLHNLALERIKSFSKKETLSDYINIVFASDAAYLPYTSVTLTSILKNYTGSQLINVFLLLDKPLSEDDKNKIEQLKNIHDFNLLDIAVDATEYNDIRTSAGISVATYYRLKLGEILPAHVEKAVYLDSDLIVLESIENLYNEPLDKNLFAGVEDSISLTYNGRFGIPIGGRHINAGVVLIDVRLMREINFSEIVEKFININQYRITLGDQQIIAELFYNSIKYVPIRWNVHGSMFTPGWVPQTAGLQNEIDPVEAEQAIAYPAIIHYTLSRKPWLSWEHPKTALWYKYVSFSSYKDDIERIAPLPPNTQAQLNNTNLQKNSGANSTKISQPKPSIISRTKKTLSALYALGQTRSTVQGVKKKVGKLEKNIINQSSNLKSSIQRLEKSIEEKSRLRSLEPASIGSEIELKRILIDRASNLPKTFDASSAIGALHPNSIIMSNVSQKDMNGGYAENIKSIFRTPSFSFFKDKTPDAVVLLSQRPKQQMFWDCIKSAYLYERPTFFIEVALFGAFSTYFDTDSTLKERRAFGFIIDDMGYYFDSRQPSRVEKTLNDGNFNLSEIEMKRAKSLISKICAESITKYNKYVSECGYKLEDGAILVIDQKKGDASIEFAGAHDNTFLEMMDKAVAENPDKPIYFKRHPDSIHRNMNSYRDRRRQAIIILPDEVSIGAVINQCDTIYTVSSQVGFEGLLRGKKVVTFGAPFYSGWGLTDDRMPITRRSTKRNIEELFHVSCIKNSIYFDSDTGKIIEMEEAIDMALQMRIDSANRVS
ncbi:hypothetical protein E4L95_16210 [Paracoccus liaowanqingii]|uniref:Capsular polysaccharide biosynthesis protein n=1 Tax=Paracoccus liaowanqingii TaxID=2560053 RepID=A0A4Z1CEP3_9RHOB|nr:glycosyltransferase [Paracoccus liaowanqingii]TGN52618.1 hypothetical protein E4L95_16210 [Paracoccus liaowanqingii]